MQAHHDGGPQARQVYDDDHGGSPCVAGEEDLRLPCISSAANRQAEALAQVIHKRISEAQST